MEPYVRPAWLFNQHVETIYPALVRRVGLQQPERERIFTPDDDFLDLDRYKQGSSQCVLISHGLEGNSTRAYVRGMARVFYNAGYDAVAWNYRGCSEEMNRQARFYHSGATDDLKTVILHLAKEYKQLFLIGFSLGGNLTLKYLGEPEVPASVKRAAVFSVPMDLYTSCQTISKPSNWIYTKRFLNSLKQKVRVKAALRKDTNTTGLETVKTLLEFDNQFTAPLHGFTDAIDYYTKSSSLPYIPAVRVPTLVVNAANDPFLSPECYPRQYADHSFVKFEYPTHGGHVGFSLFNKNGIYWSELRALSFITNTHV